MFSSVLVCHAGSTLATSVRPETHLSDFMCDLAKQTGRRNPQYLHIWVVSVTYLLCLTDLQACLRSNKS